MPLHVTSLLYNNYYNYVLVHFVCILTVSVSVQGIIQCKISVELGGYSSDVYYEPLAKDTGPSDDTLRVQLIAISKLVGADKATPPVHVRL